MSLSRLSQTSKFVRLCINIEGSGHAKIKIGESSERKRSLE